MKIKGYEMKQQDDQQLEELQKTIQKNTGTYDESNQRVDEKTSQKRQQVQIE